MVLLKKSDLEGYKFTDTTIHEISSGPSRRRV
jgi:hypothetical protein